MYVAIRYSYGNNDISVVCHSPNLLKLRELCNASINNTITNLNSNPDIIYARKYSNGFKEVIVYRIGYELLEGYIYNSKSLINDEVFSYRIIFVSDKKYYQTTFTYLTVEDFEAKNCHTMRSLPNDLLNDLQTKNKSDLL